MSRNLVRGSMTDPKPRVLLVDDDPAVLRALARELRGSFEVLDASSYEEALRVLDESPDVRAICSDFDMGTGPDGLALLAEIRRRSPEAARLLVSASLSPKEIEETVESGLAHVFIGKPWASGDVLRALKRCLD